MGLFVRPNALDTGETGADLEAVVVPGLTGVFAPKVGSATDVAKYDALVDHFERRNGAHGVEYILPIETIEGIQHCEEIALASPRVGALIGPTAEHADIAIAVGYEWSPEGLESRYHRSRILLAARAAGVHPLTALWERIRDLDGLETFTVDSRKMGFRGQVVLHPTHVPVVNRVYTPDAADVDFYRGLLKAYEDAEAAGLEPSCTATSTSTRRTPTRRPRGSPVWMRSPHCTAASDPGGTFLCAACTSRNSSMAWRSSTRSAGPSPRWTTCCSPRSP